MYFFFELLKLFTSNNFFQKNYLNFLASFFSFTFFPEFALFFPLFFPNTNCQVKKIQNQKNMLVGGKGGGGDNPII